MSLNIKNAQTYRLVRELAEATGESMTEAVTVAVRERLDRLRPNFDVEEIRLLVRDLNTRLPAGFWDVDVDKLLYDEAGVPK